MKNSMGMENRALARDALAARLAALGCSGSPWPPASLSRSEAMTTFWLRQMMPHTLRNMMVPRMAPQAIEVPWGAAK